MIKSWQEFLLEAVYKRPSRGEVVEGSPDQVEEILQKLAPWYDPINVKMPLFRSVMVGSTTKPYYPYKVMDPKKFVRKPPSTENYYNIIIDSSENWKDYPKRSRSIMAHTLESKTKMYGNKVYRVIPLRENAKCAYVGNDYWMAFGELFKSWPFGRIESLNDFNKSLRDIFNLTKKDYSVNKLKELLSSNNLNIGNLPKLTRQPHHFLPRESYPPGTFRNTNKGDWSEKIKRIESDMSFFEWIDGKMSPENTTVEIFNYDNDVTLPLSDKEYTSSEGYEVWTDEKSLLIDNDILRKLYIKKKNPVD